MRRVRIGDIDVNEAVDDGDDRWWLHFQATMSAPEPYSEMLMYEDIESIRNATVTITYSVLRVWSYWVRRVLFIGWPRSH